MTAGGGTVPVRVVLVDDQPLVRAGFAMVIDSQPDLAVVGEASDGLAGIAAAREHRADVVLMDIRMRGLDGIAATRRLTEAGRLPRVIVLTTFDDDEYLLGAIEAGAGGFLLKDAEPEALLAAIRTVHAGDAVIAPRATTRLLTHVRPARQAPPPLPYPLTPRETEVLRAIGLGWTNGEIAARFFVSEATVKTHVSRVLAKTGSRDRVQAALYAVASGAVAVEELR